MTDDEAAEAMLRIFEDPNILNFFAMVRGLRAKLVEDGWSDEHAQDIVVAMLRMQTPPGAS